MVNLSTTYSRGQLAKLTGVKGETLRYYEKCGLLDAPARRAGGHRIYTEDHAGQRKFIRHCHELGFAINEIDGLLSLANAGGKSCAQVQRAAVSDNYCSGNAGDPALTFVAPRGSAIE